MQERTLYHFLINAWWPGDIHISLNCVTISSVNGLSLVFPKPSHGPKLGKPSYAYIATKSIYLKITGVCVWNISTLKAVVTLNNWGVSCLVFTWNVFALHSKKYADRLWFVVLCCDTSQLTHTIQGHRAATVAVYLIAWIGVSQFYPYPLWLLQWHWAIYNCPNANQVTLKDMDTISWFLTTIKHNTAWTICIVL